MDIKYKLNKDCFLHLHGEIGLIICVKMVLFYSRMQMFIWNNIFFSLGFDVRDHYKDFGGDAAAYAAPVGP